jgi:hypothetical protein
VKARQGLPNRNWESSFVTIALLSKIDNIKGHRSYAGYVESQLTSIYRRFYYIVLSDLSSDHIKRRVDDGYSGTLIAA